MEPIGAPSHVVAPPAFPLLAKNLARYDTVDPGCLKFLAHGAQLVALDVDATAAFHARMAVGAR